MQPAQIRKIVKQSRKVDGWFSKEAAMMFGWVDEIQKQNGIVGDSFEIGCHHGKSAMLLGALTRPGQEKLAVCDLFEMQEDNVSGSGQGDLDIFNRNMTAARNSGVSISVFKSNSAALKSPDIGRTYRFFHVDGGHNPQEALIDLRLAAECTIESGVIALDDPFRYDWPGVTEALIRFLDEHKDFNAIAVGSNKLLLTRKNWSSMYLDEMERPAARESYGFGYPWRVKLMPFHNFDLRIFYVPDYLQNKSLGNLARLVYNKTGRIGQSMRKPVGPVIKAASDQG